MKHTPSKLFLLTSAVLPLFGCLTSCSESLTTIDIVSLNDYHGSIQQYHNNDKYEEMIASIADTYLSIKNKNFDNTYFLLMGDNTDTSAFCQFTKQIGGCDLLESLGAEFSVLGNHELNYNVDKYLDPESEKSFTKSLGIDYYLCCNAYWYDGKTSEYCDYFKPYVIKKIGDLNVGFVGYTTSSVPTFTPFFKSLYRAEAGDDEHEFCNTGMTGTEILQKAIDDCHEDALDLNDGVKPDVVILAQHEGAFRNGTTDWKSEGSYPIISRISGIDASIEGHSHVYYNMLIPDKDGKQIPCCQGKAFGSYLSDLKITYDKAKSKINCSFETPEIGTKILKGELENKKAPMIIEIEKKLEDWYNSPCEDEEFRTLADKLNNPLTSFLSDDLDEIVFPLNLEPGRSFSRASHVLTDFIVDEFNNTTVTEKPELLQKAIDKIKSNLVPETENVVDGVISASFRKDLCASGIDPVNPKIRYLRTRDMVDTCQTDGSLYAVKMTIAQINDCLSNHISRDGRVDPFYFKDYLVNWDKSHNDTYATAKEVWLCDKDGVPADENISLIVAMNKKIHNEKVSPYYPHLQELTFSNTTEPRPIKEYNYWMVNNNFPMYVNTFLNGVFDMSLYSYNERNYLYIN